MTTLSESGLTFSSDSVSLHPPPFSPSLSLVLQTSTFFFILDDFFLHHSPHSVIQYFFFLYFHLCGCIMAAVTQAVNTFTQADVILQGDSLFICMHRSPTCMLPSLTQWFELAGVWLLVAELQVQTNLSSPHYKETIVSVRQGHRRGSRKLGNIDTRMTGP